MTTVYSVITIVLFLACDYFLAMEFFRAAAMKGHAEKRYFWLCLVFTFAAYLLIIALPDRGKFVDGVAIHCEDLPEL